MFLSDLNEIFVEDFMNIISETTGQNELLPNTNDIGEVKLIIINTCSLREDFF
jgi:tRNA A37 methylthiotransferase MiaB